MATKLDLSRDVRFPAGPVFLEGRLEVPEQAAGLVLFAHGSGSSRHSSRNQAVARTIRDARIGTLLFDLLTSEEEAEERLTGHLRFDIELLGERLQQAAEWAMEGSRTRDLKIGFFGSSTGAAAALLAAARLGKRIGAVVSRGGRPDLAKSALEQVRCPTLLIVGGRDEGVVELNWEAYQRLNCQKHVEIVPGATHLFEEPGALQTVALLAAAWFEKFLRP